MTKKYNPEKEEARIQSFWKKNDYFKYSNKGKKTFTIILPPPNVTGKLHLGHAWDSYYPDMLIRYKQLNNYEAIWYPGMDHAGIATQAKVEKMIFNESGKTRFDLGRNDFLNEIWKWKELYELNIKEQWDKLGLILDYDKSKFTLDKDVNKLVLDSFVKLYEKGLIYKGKRLINWDPILQTAISNIEINHIEKKSELYNIEYDIVDSDKKIVIATTRPETMFGDVAIFVNPNDERYKKLIGKFVINPANNDKLKIMSDEYVEMEFGTGALKVTPGHDFNDYVLSKKYNLKIINIMNHNGTLNENAGEYNGINIEVARQKLINKFSENKKLISIEEHNNSIGVSERSGAVVEPMISDQWFLKSSHLAKESFAAQNNENTEVDFYPSRFETVYKNWLENMEDWCLSRQLWWGHRIPAWYKDGQIKVQIESPGKDWQQDNDVLDTWFSSSLWPIIFKNEDVISRSDNNSYLSDLLFTGYDIILFWVSRMIYQSLELNGKSPFKKAIMHGLIRDTSGKKMSKSLGNGIDPMEVIEKWGSDALRSFLLGNSTPGQDIKYNETKIQSSWDLNNKLYNAGNLLIHLSNGNKFKRDEINEYSLIDKYAISSINKFRKILEDNIEEYNLTIIFSEMQKLIFDDISNGYLEFVKQDKNNLSNAINIFVDLLILLHPIIPFTTEMIYSNLRDIINLKESILLERYSKIEKIEKNVDIDTLLSSLKVARTINSNSNFKKGNKIEIFIENDKIFDRALINKYINFLSADISNIKKDEYLNIEVYPGVGIIYSTFEGAKNKPILELKKEIKSKLEFELKRAKGLLANEKFVSNAAKNLIISEENKVEFYSKSIELLK